MKPSISLSDRATIIMVMHDEETLRDAGKPYSEAVIALCELYLDGFTVTERCFIEASLPKEID